MTTGSDLTKVLYDRLKQRGRDIKSWANLPQSAPYCAATVSYAMYKTGHLKDWCGGQKVTYVPTALLWMKKHWKHVSMVDARPGDVVVFTWSGRGNNSNPTGVSRDHIGFIRAKGTSKIAYTIEGNTNGGIVDKRTRELKYIHSIWRPSFLTGEKVTVPAYPTVTIKKGDVGVQVLSAQKFFNKYINAGLELDSDFGRETEKATKVYQRKKNIEDDGIIGVITRGKMKADVEGKTPTTRKYVKGIDVSYWQGKINWNKVKADGISRAICRLSYTGTKAFKLSVDSTFDRNVKEANKAKFKYIGAYHFSQATTIAEAVSEAEYVVNKLKPYKKMITGAVVIDWEFAGRLSSSVAKKNGKDINTAIVMAFCKVIRNAGYTPMVYANYSTFRNYLNYTEIKRDAKIWLAQYADKAGYTSMDVWQYSSSGSVDGINGRVDVNKFYI